MHAVPDTPAGRGCYEPAYLSLYQSGILAERVHLAREALRCCRLCGWQCGIDRNLSVGPCRVGIDLAVSTAYLHQGEERPLSQGAGSGAIFFTLCELRCQYCQTFRWNIQGKGAAIITERCAQLMLELQDKGASNINLVTPTHVLPQVLESVVIAAERGLHLPLVWNSAGYDSLDALRLLDGIVDIYLPDCKYGNSELARRLSGIPDYAEVNRQALREMARQVGPLCTDSQGKAQRGLVVRHLVLPGYMQNTEEVLRWIASEMGRDVYLSLMDQYVPAYRAWANPNLNRTISRGEFLQAYQLARALGFKSLDASSVRFDQDIEGEW
nr:radical SAM protein [Anaerolineae bacterium]